MRYLLAAVGVCLAVSVAEARPPSAATARKVAERWRQAVLHGDARGVAAVTALPITVSLEGVDHPPWRSRTRAELVAAVPTWRRSFDMFRGAVPWRDGEVGDHWREETIELGGESFGSLTVRVSRAGRVTEVRAMWSWGGI